MRKSWTMPVAALVAGAAVAVACGGSDGANADRRAEADRGGRPDQPATATVALSGCLQQAPGSHQYVLRHVRFEPRAGDPHATTTTSGGHGITEGAWVRLDGGDQDLNRHLGERVLINGAVTDDGRNTIGTAGTPGVQTPAGETSQAASPEHHSDKVKKEAGRLARESMADGTAAKITVQKISGTGDRCTEPRGR